MIDWRGTEVKVGDQVIYCVRSGSSMSLVEGVVLSVDFKFAEVQVVRRQRKYVMTKPIVKVGPSYLTVVTMPVSEAPTQDALIAERDARIAELRREREEILARRRVDNDHDS